MVDTTGCINNTIRLGSGRYFDLAAPAARDIDIEDIAGALSKICRFGAHIDRFYSVAEHSVHCADVATEDGLPPEARLAVLLHDAAEAYVGDMVRPLKIMLPAFSAVEESVLRAIAAAIGVDFSRWKPQIRAIDNGVLFAEKNLLFSRDDIPWTGESEARKLTVPVACWAPDVARELFLLTYCDVIKDVRRAQSV